MNYDDYTGYKTTVKFREASLQPCGSMAEKTSLWKSIRRQDKENKFIEYDFLAVLNADNVVVITRGGNRCCRRIYSENKILHSIFFRDYFLSALYARIDSMCSCRVDLEDTMLEADRRDPILCAQCCTVVMNTGYLQIAKIPYISPDNVKAHEDCNIVFYWTSLLAPNVESLELTEKIKRLVIRVDILPAFEVPENRDGDEARIKLFVIAKTCSNCGMRDCFMVSYCMHELNAIRHVSEKHKQSYIIIKFLYGQFIYWTGAEEGLNTYYAKVAFIKHCQTCTDDQKDCTTCISEILQSLIVAYTSQFLDLPEFHPVKSLMFRRYDDTDMHYVQIPILSLLHVLPKHKSHSENTQCNSQYRPCHVVGLIKRTCRILLEGGRPGINVDGKFFYFMLPHNCSRLLKNVRVACFCVRVLKLSNMYISDTSGPIEIKFYPKHHCDVGNAALGFGPDRIRSLIWFEPNDRRIVSLSKTL